MADEKKRRRTDLDSDEETRLPFKTSLNSDAFILDILKELAKSNTASTNPESSSTSNSVTLQDLGLSSTCPDVSDLSLSSAQSAILNDDSCMLGCTRSSLRLSVIDSAKGMVVGCLIYSDNGDVIDCTKMGLGGGSIPPIIESVGDMHSDALFILLVEKFSTYHRLIDDKFYHRFPCIIVLTKGHPDVATKLFLTKLKMELKLPVLAIVDCDPCGLKILSICGCGPKNMSSISSDLTILDIKWLGIRPSDLDKYKIPDNCRLPMTERDIKKCKNMLEEDFVKKNRGWVEELTLMVKTKQKAEIEALSSFGFRYLSEVYLPHKLQELDWI